MSNEDDAVFAAKKLWSYCVRFFLGVGVALDGYSIVCAASAFLFSCILMSAGPYRFREWDALVRASELAGIAIVYAWSIAIPVRVCILGVAFSASKGVPRKLFILNLSLQLFLPFLDICYAMRHTA